MRSSARSLVAIATALAAGCAPNDPLTSPTGDPSVERQNLDGRGGVYVLRSVAGDRLPAVVLSNEAAQWVALADTLWLHGDGTGALVMVSRVTEPRPPRQYVLRTMAELLYTLDGNRLTAEVPCRDVIVLGACVAPPHYTGTFSANALDLGHAIVFRVPMHYDRVAGPTPVTDVRISPSTDLSVRVGGSLQLSAEALDAQGRVLAGKVPTWTSLLSGNATVSGTGVVTGVAEGITLVHAFVEGRADTVTVHVTR